MPGSEGDAGPRRGIGSKAAKEREVSPDLKLNRPCQCVESTVLSGNGIPSVERERSPLAKVLADGSGFTRRHVLVGHPYRQITELLVLLMLVLQ